MVLSAIQNTIYEIQDFLLNVDPILAGFGSSLFVLGLAGFYNTITSYDSRLGVIQNQNGQNGYNPHRAFRRQDKMWYVNLLASLLALTGGVATVTETLEEAHKLYSI